MGNNTIITVVRNGLCSGCGTCIALCPEKAIDLIVDEKKGVYVPQLRMEKCSECGTCLKVCPRHKIDLEKMNHQIFNKKPENILIGNFLECYIGHTKDNEIRFKSSSGGIITQLLIFALEEGIIDGALVVRFKKDSPLEPEPFIARTKEEIISSSGSKYCPVPLNIVLREILESKIEEKFAVVGLPCHIQGIRRAEQINKRLREKIVLHLGLFCNHAPSIYATKLYLRRKKISEREVTSFEYRGNGWPGNMTINSKIIKFRDYWDFIGSHFFWPKECLLCEDGLCEFSDISFGDAWIQEMSKDKIGSSIVIIRDKKGQKLFEAMKLRKIIEINNTTEDRVIQSQRVMIYIKKKRTVLQKFLYFNSCIGSKPVLRKLLIYVPIKIVQIYHLPYWILISRKAKKL